MPFVAERMPEEEKEKITFPVSTRRDGSTPTLSKWVVDRERSAFLVMTGSSGGAYEGTQLVHEYVLNWDGLLTYFSADPHLGGRVPEGSLMQWSVHDWKVSEGLQGRKEQVKQLIREALDVQGYVHDRRLFAKVDVDFDGCF